MAQDLTGQTLGHYHIVQPIDKGGMASVFLANDIHLRRHVAIKVFQPLGDYERTREFSLRFAREARIVARLDHPNILPVYDYGEQDGLAYLVMPYLATGSLKHLLSEQGPPPIPRALHLILQLLDALQYAHDRGLIHRDIKPGNILFKNAQTPVLADFGLVKELATGETGKLPVIRSSITRPLHSISSDFVMGTPYYMAPEQVRGQVRPASDIYSMGLVLYEMLTGQHPFVVETKAEAFKVFFKQLYEAPRPITALNPSIPAALAEIVMRALEKDPDRRYRRPSDFARALRLVERKSSLTISPASETPPSGVSHAAATVPVPTDLPAAVPPPVVDRTPLSSSNPQYQRPYTTIPAALAPPPRTIPIRKRHTALPFSILTAIILAALVLAGLLHFMGLGFPADPTQAHRTLTGRTTTSTHSQPTTPMQPTQTSCPPAGQGRAAIMAPYQPRGDHAVVYTSSVYSVTGGTPEESGALMLHNTATGKSNTILSLPYRINEAQISGDGEWIIFVAEPASGSTTGVAKIQMVRIDGQGLQTLYCSAPAHSIHDLLLSPGTGSDDQHMVFTETDNNDHSDTPALTVSMQNVAQGLILQHFVTHHELKPITWLNEAMVYLLDQGPAPVSSRSRLLNLYLISVNDSIPAQDPIFKTAINVPAACSDLDFSPDFRTIFESQCQGVGLADRTCGGCPPTEGPSILNAVHEDLTTGSGWSSPAPFYTSHTQAIIQVRAVTPSTLLFLVGNNDLYKNQNGLWKVNTDGNGLQRLTTEKGQDTMLNQDTQYPWSNVSRDGSLLAYKTGSEQAAGLDTLCIVPLNGGEPTTIAADGVGGINPSANLQIAGWIMI